MTPDETVTAFITAIERMDVDAAAELLATTVVYENVPMQAVTGREVVRESLTNFLSTMTHVEWPVSVQVATGNHVANERVDRFKFEAGWLEVRVAGFFEIDDDGLIAVWRDYFDLAEFTNQMAALQS